MIALKDVAKLLAPRIDSGERLYAKVSQKLGGNGYNYGLEIYVSNNRKLISKLKPKEIA